MGGVHHRHSGGRLAQPAGACRSVCLPDQQPRHQYTAAKAGIGLALLPCYLGEGDADLVRPLPDPVPELAGELWIVTHADLKRTARVRAFFEIVGEGLAREQDRFEGRK